VNQIYAFLTEIGLTLAICILVITYLHPFLKRILVDFCATEERANFWNTFITIILIALPLLSALGYVPSIGSGVNLIYEVAGKIKDNLFNFVLGLIGIGFVLLFFSASISRANTTRNEE